MPVFLKVEDVHKTYILKRRRFFLEDDEDDDEDDDERTRGAGLNGGDAESGAPSNPEDDQQPSLREVQALRGISFEAKAGDVIGIVGSRGAGKSTLINIIARKTLPTSGTVQGSGLVVCINDMQRPLSSVFSCRRNLFMAAAMLGVKSKEIAPLVEEAADLAGAQKYLDVVVSRMPRFSYAQLAAIFALLLEPDILLVDETNLWAAGSGKKSFDALLRDLIAKRNSIVLIASNKPSIIDKFTNYSLWLRQGQIVEFSRTRDVVLALSISKAIPGQSLPGPGGPPASSDRGSKEVLYEMLNRVSELNLNEGAIIKPDYCLVGPCGQKLPKTVGDHMSRMAQVVEAENLENGSEGHSILLNKSLGPLGDLISVCAHTARRRGVTQVLPGEDVTIELIVRVNDPRVIFDAATLISIACYNENLRQFSSLSNLLKTVPSYCFFPKASGLFAIENIIPGHLMAQMFLPTLCRAHFTLKAHSSVDGGPKHAESVSVFWMVRGDLNSGIRVNEQEGNNNKPHRQILRPELDWRFMAVKCLESESVF